MPKLNIIIIPFRGDMIDGNHLGLRVVRVIEYFYRGHAIISYGFFDDNSDITIFYVILLIQDGIQNGLACF